MDIGQVVFFIIIICMFMSRDEVEVHKRAKKSHYPDRTSLVNKSQSHSSPEQAGQRHLARLGSQSQLLDSVYRLAWSKSTMMLQYDKRFRLLFMEINETQRWNSCSLNSHFITQIDVTSFCVCFYLLYSSIIFILLAAFDRSIFQYGSESFRENLYIWTCMQVSIGN